MKHIIRIIIRVWDLIKRKTVFYLKNKITFYINNIAYDSFPIIRGTIFVRNYGCIKMGRDIYINSGIKENPIGGDTKTILTVFKDGSITIGNNVGLSNCCLFSQLKISVGNNVLIGGGCKIYDTDFHPLLLEDRIIGKEKSNKVKCLPVLIEDGAFIGSHSIILKGVTIGQNSIIGAGSLVTRNIPKNEIWAGNPARFIKALN